MFDPKRVDVLADIAMAKHVMDGAADAVFAQFNACARWLSLSSGCSKGRCARM